jgi:hypothetical protein
MKRYVIAGIGLAVALLGTGFFTGLQVGKGQAELAQKLEAIEARQLEADQTAQSVVGALGRFCASFDFFFEHDMANGAFRPVRCSIAGESRTALFAYGFDASETQEAWVSEWGRFAAQRGVTLLEDGAWAIEVLNQSIAEDVRSTVLSSLIGMTRETSHSI